MKTISLLLSALFFTTALHAAPLLVIEATLVEQHADGSKEVVNARPATVAAGVQTVLSLGAYEMAITPELKDGGIVVVPMLITKGNAADGRVVSRPTITTKLGTELKVETGDLAFTVVVKLPK